MAFNRANNQPEQNQPEQPEQGNLAQPEQNVITPQKGVCHGCQRNIIDIPNQWVDGKGSEENAKLICICIDCVKKGITHQSLGLDIKKCE